VIVLIDIEKLPNNGRMERGSYQGHYIIAYKMDDANVSILIHLQGRVKKRGSIN
jgi:hypothetical protein